jgi:hypothetical protein
VEGGENRLQVERQVPGGGDWGLGNFHPLAPSPQRLVPAFPHYCLLPTAYCLLLPGVSTKSGGRLFSDLFKSSDERLPKGEYLRLEYAGVRWHGDAIMDLCAP